MRHYESFQLPRGLKSLLLNSLSKAYPQKNGDWKQAPLHELAERPDGTREFDGEAVRGQLVKATREATGLNVKNEFFSVVLHESQSDIESHTDGMARTCFLVPLICTPTQVFHEEFQRRPLVGAKMLRFNDYLHHGVSNPYCGRMVLMTMSLERR